MSGYKVVPVKDKDNQYIVVTGSGEPVQSGRIFNSEKEAQSEADQLKEKDNKLKKPPKPIF